MTIEWLGAAIKVWANGDLVYHGYDCMTKKRRIAVQAEGSDVEFKRLTLSHITEFSS